MEPLTATTRRRLYRHPLSGHSHRAQLMLALLDLTAEMVDIDMANGEHKSPAYLARNPFGQVPLLEDGDVCLADSNAILVYLAVKHDARRRWYPDDALTIARIQQWLAIAAGPLVQGPALARLRVVFGVPIDAPKVERSAMHLLGQMELHLSGREYLVAARPTIADVAMYSYTAHAPEGGISLEPFPEVRAWLRRIEGLDGFVEMQPTPTARAA